MRIVVAEWERVLVYRDGRFSEISGPVGTVGWRGAAALSASSYGLDCSPSVGRRS